MIHSIQEQAFRYRAVRWVVALFFLCRGAFRMRQGRLYRALIDYCFIERVSNVGLRRFAWPVIIESVRRDSPRNADAIVASFRSDLVAASMIRDFPLDGTGRHDLFRDLIVLKSPAGSEKGVILLKYARTFSVVMAVLDMKRLMERYSFVLEPCWAGYCDPSLLMFASAKQPVFVQCFTDSDFQFVTKLGPPFIPLHMGPADWVDADLFSPAPVAKSYDVVMVANWARHKRHALLFEALKRVRDRQVRILLIGFPWADRTAADIRREAETAGASNLHIDIVEKLPAAEVAGRVSESRAFVFLSRKEGDNKALVESMFVNVPTVVYKHTIGGATSRINNATGVLADEHELADAILSVIDHPETFSPREWALANTGSRNTTRRLNEALRAAANDHGQVYSTDIVEKTNSPNLAYKDLRCRARFEADYDFVRSCERQRVAPVQTAVA